MTSNPSHGLPDDEVPFSPDFLKFHKSICYELTAVKDRVRSLVRHWGTDGAFKEAALRAVLRRHLPAGLKLGSGFIVDRDYSSTQIDVLVVHGDKPLLFQDGDLLIVTPDAALAAIEVKTTLTMDNARDAARKLARFPTSALIVSIRSGPDCLRTHQR